jgi:hypothetical protein
LLGELRISRVVDEEEIDDKLNDLDPRYPFLPPNSNATGGLEVVPVHDDVDGQVKGNWDIALHVNLYHSEMKILPQRYGRLIE